MAEENHRLQRGLFSEEMNPVPNVWLDRYERVFGETTPTEQREFQEKWQRHFDTTVAAQQDAYFPLGAYVKEREPPVIIFSGGKFIPKQRWLQKASWPGKIVRYLGYHTNIYQFSQVKKISNLVQNSFQVMRELSTPPTSLAQLHKRYRRFWNIQATAMLAHWFLETATTDDLISLPKHCKTLASAMRAPHLLFNLICATALTPFSPYGFCQTWNLGPLVFSIKKIQDLFFDLTRSLGALATTRINLGELTDGLEKEPVAKLHDSEKSMILSPLARPSEARPCHADGGLPSRAGEEAGPREDLKGRFCASKSFAIGSKVLIEGRLLRHQGDPASWIENLFPRACSRFVDNQIGLHLLLQPEGTSLGSVNLLCSEGRSLISFFSVTQQDGMQNLFLALWQLKREIQAAHNLRDEPPLLINDAANLLTQEQMTQWIEEASGDNQERLLQNPSQVLPIPFG